MFEEQRVGMGKGRIPHLFLQLHVVEPGAVSFVNDSGAHIGERKIRLLNIRTARRPQHRAEQKNRSREQAHESFKSQADARGGGGRISGHKRSASEDCSRAPPATLFFRKSMSAVRRSERSCRVPRLLWNRRCRHY